VTYSYYKEVPTFIRFKISKIMKVESESIPEEHSDEKSIIENVEDSRECRVCRSNSEDGRPLFMPCLCNGSIGLVHQDCLEAWLTHSRKVYDYLI